MSSKLLLSGDLPENVIVAFTGNEEEDGKSGCRGAKGVAQMLSAFYPKISSSYITLDVTDVCHIKNWDATVECRYDHKKLAKKIRERMPETKDAKNNITLKEEEFKMMTNEITYSAEEKSDCGKGGCKTPVRYEHAGRNRMDLPPRYETGLYRIL